MIGLSKELFSKMTVLAKNGVCLGAFLNEVDFSPVVCLARKTSSKQREKQCDQTLMIPAPFGWSAGQKFSRRIEPGAYRAM